MAKHKHDWAQAKKLCRLNQNDIAMAKSLGFRPATLVRARPDPKQKWKLPVKEWIHELHFKRFGFVLGEAPILPPPAPKSPPQTPEEIEEAARIYGEQLYWENYCERNQEDRPKRRLQQQVSQPPPPPSPTWPEFDPFVDEDSDVPS